ncbi:glycoside hydrolase family 3 N-terminal domain-containing protein [Paracoccus pacificus]|uniref:beta-N-acetylhexosaminidase n=1 Tax=Paracoccus pacificus TaxID=1463598 RepID=A0ABW4R312_9RHOB
MTEPTTGRVAAGRTGAAIFGLEGVDLTPAERDFFRDADPLGFILFARNVQDPAQLTRLTGKLRDAVGRDAMILVDQEGGRVQRLRAPHWTEWMPPLDQAPLGARAMRLRYRLIGAELREVGIDADCAPTLDIAQPETHPFLRNRCLGEDVETVIELGRAAADGLLEAGVLPVIKHMPGHGRAVADSHHDLPAVPDGLAELEARDFAPFRALADLPMAMTGHILFTALDTRPATISPTLIGIIREAIGFDGLLMTDDISMKALSGTEAERSAAAIAAGCDVVLSCHGVMTDMTAVAAASGTLTEAAARRANRALALRGAAVPDGAEIARIRAEFAGLVGAA